jgi:predicted nuclease of predicted toxin-antitoxin system
MRILLDENLDWRLKRALPGHIVESVQSNGWHGIENGALLARAAAEFDVFLTMDGNIQYQQDYTKLALIIVTLKASSNRLKDTLPFIPKLLAALPSLKPGTLTVLS